VQSQGFTVLGDYGLAALMRRSPAPLLLREIADLLRLTRPGVTGRIDRLAAQGIVERQPNDADKRSVFIVLTTTGERLVDSAFDQLMAA